MKSLVLLMLLALSGCGAWLLAWKFDRRRP